MELFVLLMVMFSSLVFTIARRHSKLNIFSARIRKAYYGVDISESDYG